MSPELLYPMVTEAIRKAETLKDLGAPGAAAAFLDVSLLEEKIAETLPPTDPEGAVARRGAVRAALSAGEFGRARQLVERYLTDAEIDEALRSNLVDMSREAGLEIEALMPPSTTEDPVIRLRLATEEMLNLIE